MGGTAATICWRPDQTEILGWSTPADAFEAAKIIPCGRGCAGAHAALYRDGDRIRIAVPPAPQPVFVLAAALAECYPRRAFEADWAALLETIGTKTGNL